MGLQKKKFNIEKKSEILNKFLLTYAIIRCTVISGPKNKLIIDFLLFRAVEIQRICEAAATPEMEGANLSEIIRTIRGFNDETLLSPRNVGSFFYCIRNFVSHTIKAFGKMRSLRSGRLPAAPLARAKWKYPL